MIWDEIGIAEEVDLLSENVRRGGRGSRTGLITDCMLGGLAMVFGVLWKFMIYLTSTLFFSLFLRPGDAHEAELL